MQRNTFQKRTKTPLMLIIMLITILVMIVIIFFNVFSSFNDHKYVVTVTDKDRITYDGNSKYLVFADGENGESLVFENTDTVIRLKWDSSNIQGSLHEGETYEITVIGYRIPFMSKYENIIEVEEITE